MFGSSLSPHVHGRRRAPSTPPRISSLVAILLIAASCSSGADAGRDASFAGGYQRVTDEYRTTIDDIKTQAQNASGQGLERILALYEEILGVTEAARDDYSQLRPPDDLEDELDLIVSLLDRQVEALDALVASGKEQDVSGVSSAAGELTELMAEWNSARTRLDELLEN